MREEIIMLIVAGLLLMGALVLKIFATKKNSFVLGIMTLAVLALSIVFAIKAEEPYVENKISSGDYTVYIDGVGVDRTKIDIKQYKVTFNEETHEVYCTSM